MISVGDRRVEIETGYGVEAILPDAKVGNIIDTQIIPRFKKGDFEGGTLAGTKALIVVLDSDRVSSVNQVKTPNQVASANVETTKDNAILWILVTGSGILVLAIAGGVYLARPRKIFIKQQEQKRLVYLRQRLLFFGASIVTALAVWTGWTYNSIQSSSTRVEAAWAQVENQLQRRADLIPNLVNVTQANAKQEKELVSLLVRSRQTYLQAATPNQKAAATVQINQAIDRFYNYAAANPQLQSSQLFINLQYELTGTENRLAVERMRYNQTVQAYNQKIQSFPNLLVANTFGFENKEFFQATLRSP